MELHLGLALSSSASSCSSRFNPNRNTEYIHESKISVHHPKKRKHDDDDDDEVQSNYLFVHQRNDGGMIGWPPVKLCRKKLCHQKMGTGGGQGVEGKSKSMYIKVHMEGVGIARKVDLNLHQSYQTLVPTLANMFDKCFEDVKLTYQDKEGDWLLGGDVPWGGTDDIKTKLDQISGSRISICSYQSFPLIVALTTVELYPLLVYNI